MLLKKKTKIALFALLVASTPLVISSCGFLVRGVVKSSLKTSNNSLPSDLDLKNTTLLVMLWSEGYDRYARKAWGKKYGGKMEYVTFADIKTEKYANTDKYRYAFSQGPGKMELYTKDSYSFVYSGSRPFHLYDRKTGKFYDLHIRSGLTQKVIEAYAMRFEGIRTGKKPLK